MKIKNSVSQNNKQLHSSDVFLSAFRFWLNELLSARTGWVVRFMFQGKLRSPLSDVWKFPVPEYNKQVYL